MVSERYTTGPGPHSSIPQSENSITQHFISASSRRNSIQSSQHGYNGNILELFNSHEFEHEDFENFSNEESDMIVNENTPLRHTHELRNPKAANALGFDNSLTPCPSKESYGTRNRTRNDSLSTLKKMRSQSTINYVLSHGQLPEVETTIMKEIRILNNYSIPLIVTFLLQYSLNVASVFSVGKIGKLELAAVSLANMTANLTGYCVFQGISTSLDTLCAQAYGRKDYKLVGVHFTRCFLFLLALCLATSVIWKWFSYQIILVLVNDVQLSKLASDYLSVLSWGLPGFILYETLKRFLQSQNIFHASTYVILIAAPFNAFLNYYLVWSEPFNLGFIGAPIAIVCTNYLMALLMLAYTVLIDGYQCWHGLSKEVFYFKNWSKMISLSINGCIGVLSEWFAFEALTLTAAQFGTVVLASQSIIITVTTLLYQIPFAISIAASTRIANLVGALSKKSVVTSANACLIYSLTVGIVNFSVFFIFKDPIIKLFTEDEDVIRFANKIIPLIAFYQINDCLATVSGGVLRGQGRQKLTAIISLISYYLISFPIGFTLAFIFNLELFGLWLSLSLAIILISVSQTFFIMTSKWEAIINESIQDSLIENNVSQEVRSILNQISEV